MALPVSPSDDSSVERIAFLNLAALSYGLGLIGPQGVHRPRLHDALVRYTLDFLDVSWMLYRAALRQLEPSVDAGA